MKNQIANDSTFSIRDFLGGVIIGGVAGAVTAYLTTPQTGKKTRAQLRKKGLQLQKQATGTVDDAWTQVEEALEQALAKGQQVKDDTGNKVKALGKRGQDMLDERIEQVESVLESLRSARD